MVASEATRRPDPRHILVLFRTLALSWQPEVPWVRPSAACASTQGQSCFLVPRRGTVPAMRLAVVTAGDSVPHPALPVTRAAPGQLWASSRLQLREWQPSPALPSGCHWLRALRGRHRGRRRRSPRPHQRRRRERYSRMTPRPNRTAHSGRGGPLPGRRMAAPGRPGRRRRGSHRHSRAQVPSIGQPPGLRRAPARPSRMCSMTRSSRRPSPPAQ